MKVAAILVLLTCTGCAVGHGAGESPPPPPVPGTGECQAEDAQALVGQPATEALGADALRRAGARTIRWIQPGTAVTMDYRQDRLNIWLDEKNVVARINCG